MSVPKLLATSVQDATYAGVTYHVQGELVPALQLELAGVPVYFEHHILLWKDPSVQIGVKSLKGAFKRMMAGMPVFITEARGPGRIAFSRDGAGHVVGIPMRSGDVLDVREHQFLAATDGVDYSFARLKGVSNMLFGGTGFFIDTFSCRDAEGMLWIHGYGNLFEINLEHGEQIDIEPGGWVYKDRTVGMQTMMQSLKTGLFASAGQLVWNRFTGPGRVCLQSMYVHLPTSD